MAEDQSSSLWGELSWHSACLLGERGGPAILTTGSRHAVTTEDWVLMQFQEVQSTR